MSRIRLLCSLSFIAAVFSSTAPGLAQVWTTAANYIDAKAQAQAEGKLILGDFGQAGCTDCETFELLLHNTSLGISQMVQAGFVYWPENYHGADTRAWTAALGGVALPYVFYIDPNAPPGSAVSASAGAPGGGGLASILRVLSQELPLVVTNFPGGVLGTNALRNGYLTLGGLARTNSPLATTIRGVAISNIWCRVREAGGAFAPARMAPMNSAFVSWAADFQPVNGTNTFDSYVEYANGAKSWTNTARLVYHGGPVVIPPSSDTSPPSLAIINYTNLEYADGSPISLRGTASDAGQGGSGITNVTVNGLQATNDTASGSAVANWSRQIDLDAGINPITVVATDGAGNSSTVTVQILLGSSGVTPQTITFTNNLAKTYGDAPLPLTATADSALLVSYFSDNPNVATISSSNVTIVGKGTSVITAYQPGNANYQHATNVAQALTVAPAELTVMATNQSKIYGQELSFAGTEFTASGLTNSDTVTAVALSSAGAVATATVAGSPYSIEATNAQGTRLANYNIVYPDGQLTVNPAGTTTLPPSPVSGASGSSVSLTAKVNAQSPSTAVVNEGTVTFTIKTNGNSIGSATSGTVSNGSASANFSLSGVGAGSYTIEASYNPPASSRNFNSSSASTPGVLTVSTIDTVPPALTINSYADLQVVATNKITLAGTASDEGGGGSGIASVKVNGLLANNGTASGSGEADWSLVVNLSPGTNTIKVVATDNALAHNSATNVIRIISDTVRPSLRITAPTVNQRWSNAVFSVKGTAGDNLRVAGVWCLTNGVWGLASTSNGWTNWTVDVALVAGSNTVKAYAVDTAGNKSPTNNATFVYVATDRLQLSTVGNGTVSGNYSNAVLEVGKGYSITAIPGMGSLFSNWVGSVAGSVVISSNAASLSFLMQSNLVLQANFVPNPFTPLQGTYNGLFFPTDNFFMATNAAATNSGFMGLTLTGQGKYSGSLLLDGGSLTITGQFGLGLQSQVSLARQGKPGLTLNLQLNPTIYHPEMDMTDTNVLTGTVAEGGQWISDLCAYRAATGNSNVYAGACTVLLEGCDDWGLCFGDGFSDLPNGDSPASVTISSKGAIQVAGTLADGTAFTRAVMASEQGLWPLYVPLYGGQGFLMGWVTLTTNQSAASVTWAMPPGLSRHYNTNGFVQSRLLLLTEYTAPPPGHNAVNWSNATVKITGGDLPQPADSANVLQSQILVSNNIVRVISGTISNLTVSITASNGLFKGSFVDPVSKRPTSFSGALATDPGTPVDGGGWWLGPRGQGGNIRLVAP